jgi:phosphoribosylglycinamide formyltransferase 1
VGPRLPIAVLVSGEGTTLEALAELAEAGKLPADLRLVVSDRPNAPALEKARRHGLPTLLLPTRGVDREEWARRLTAALEEHGVELVLLAGFMSILPDSWVARWHGRALNLHPSLLPKFGGHGMYGAHVHEAVLAAHETESGATVQLVTGNVDRGLALLQERVPVLPGDTPASLRQRIHPVEVRLLAEAVRRFADGTWSLPYPGPLEPARDGRERSPAAR